jgi:hypothetical protein
LLVVYMQRIADRNRYWRRDFKKGWTDEQTKLINYVEKRLKTLRIRYNFLGPSLKTNKKLRLAYTDADGKLRSVDFGDKNSITYAEHKDEAKRAAYIARHSKIFLKDGRRAIDVQYTPAWASFALLWN